jgi:plasmid stability protein
MANLSLRNLDPETLARIRTTARRRGVSVNRLIVDTLRREYAIGGEALDDLDRLAGAWTEAEAEAFTAATAPFAEIDGALWAAEPSAQYKTRSGTKRRAAK